MLYSSSVESLFSKRVMVGWEQRSISSSGRRPQHIFRMLSLRNRSQSSASSYPAAIWNTRWRIISARGWTTNFGLRSSCTQDVILSRILVVVSYFPSRAKPPKEDSDGALKSAVTFFLATDPRSKRRFSVWKSAAGVVTLSMARCKCFIVFCFTNITLISLISKWLQGNLAFFMNNSGYRTSCRGKYC